MKWQNWKLLSKELDKGTDAVKEYPIPRLFNLNLDPKEEHALSYEYQHFWAGKYSAGAGRAVAEVGSPVPRRAPVGNRPGGLQRERGRLQLYKGHIVVQFHGARAVVKRDRIAGRKS